MVGLLLCHPAIAAENNSFTNLLAQGEATGQQGDVPGALKIYSNADTLASNNSAELCALTKHYCDLMYDTTAPDLQKILAQTALDCAQRALKADPANAIAHLCVAVGYVKNFPYTNNETKMKWSKAVKVECETAIKLDPKQDVGYYLLGRWNYNTANLSFIYKGLARLIYGALPPASNEEAIKDFQKAIELAPNRIIHHHQLAVVYAATSRKKLAIAELEKCQTLKPVDRDDEQAEKEAVALLSTLK
jgi:tetratricopeptide (TPR) repeat protein